MATVNNYYRLLTNIDLTGTTVIPWDPSTFYQDVTLGVPINFIDQGNQVQAKFLMIRAHDQDIVVRIGNYNYGILIPERELFSIDSIKDMTSITVVSSSDPSNTKINWQIGY